MLLHEASQSHIIPKSRRASSKGTSHSRSAQSTPSASPSRPSSPSSASGRIEQAFHLTSNGHSTPWLSLRVKSNASPSKAHPLYFDRDTVEGSVHLNLAENQTSVVAVVVIVRGQVFSVGADQTPFLELSQTLWSNSNHNARDTTSGLRRLPALDRLSGAYSWPFSIPLPSHVVVANSQGRPVSVPLPPTFAPKGFPAFIDYKIQVLIQRGPLRVDHTLTTSFVYLPRARAPRPSHLLESAYQNHHPVMGPSLDPEGWDTLPFRTVSGVLFGTRSASVDCTLSLSRPMPQSPDRRNSGNHDSSPQQHRVYARDCLIHAHIALQSRDAQLLDLLSTSALRIQLVQLIRSQPAESTTQPHTVHRIYKVDPTNNQEEAVVIGTCWRSNQSNGVVQSMHQRHFEAEIIIKKDLKPSFTFPTLSLQYAVQLSFSATGFTGAQDQIIFSEPVTIVTDRPRGPSPNSRVPATN